MTKENLIGKLCQETHEESHDESNLNQVFTPVFNNIHDMLEKQC